MVVYETLIIVKNGKKRLRIQKEGDNKCDVTDPGIDNPLC